MRGPWNVVAAIGGFCLACALLAQLAERPTLTTRTLNYLEAHGDEYEIVFVGPSYVERQILPSVFDEQLARRGYPLRSFNFGLSAMSPEEQTEVTRRISKLSLPYLEWIVSDVTLPEYHRFEQDNPMKSRTIEWHTIQTLWRATRMSWESGTLPELWPHALHTLARYTNLGLGVDRLRRFAAFSLPEEPQFWATPEGQQLRKRRKAGISEARHRGLLEEMAECREQKDREEIDRTRAPEIAALLDPTGIKSAFLISPVSYRCWGASGEDLRGRPVAVFAFNDPDRYPELYAARHRVNENHVNYRGSAIYSRVIADALANHLDQIWSKGERSR